MKKIFQVKRLAILIALVCVMVMVATGCRVKVNTDPQPDIEELLENTALEIDPVAYNLDGKYEITVHYAKGGFEDMDLSQAYVAYYPFTLQDQIDGITGEGADDDAAGNADDDGEIPPLPVDAQNAMDDVMGENDIQKIVVIVVKTLDDQTLTVSFSDQDNALRGREYYFVIPNEGLAGSVIPE